MGRIGKNLAGLLRKTAIVSSFVIPVFFSGCGEENYNPVAKQEVNPIYGEAPLNVRIKETGDDLNGIDDIKLYQLYVNDKLIKSKSTPIDTVMTFENPGTVRIYGKVIDSTNESDKTEVISVEVDRGPFIEQSVSLFNDIDLKYSATLSKVNKAELKVNREGVLISTKEINDVNQSGADYEKDFTYTTDGFTKGNYEFILKSDNLEKRISVDIPNYKPTSSIENINIVLNEEADSTITLPTPFDKNPEDNPVPFQSAKSLDGKTQVTLNGYIATIKALKDKVGDYQVEVEFGSTIGGLEKATLEGQIIAHTWKYLVNPFVQPNDTTKPIVWNNFSTTNQRNDYFNDRLYNYDKTDTLNIPGWVCTDYARAWIIAFNGYPMEGLQNNNWHNIPAYDITFRVYNNPSHATGGVIVGDDVTNIDDWRFIEPRTDSTYSSNILKQLGVYNIQINYIFVNKYDGLLDGIPMFEFILNEKNEWKDSGYRNPEINLIEEREK